MTYHIITLRLQYTDRLKNMQPKRTWTETNRLTGWWFGCHQLFFPINIGLLIIPIDGPYFSEGFFPNHQPAYVVVNPNLCLPFHKCVEKSCRWEEGHPNIHNKSNTVQIYMTQHSLKLAYSPQEKSEGQSFCAHFGEPNLHFLYVSATRYDHMMSLHALNASVWRWSVFLHLAACQGEYVWFGASAVEVLFHGGKKPSLTSGADEPK